MRILYGTSNPAKIQHMKNMLFGLDLEIIGLNGVNLNIDYIDESGNDPLENAKIKAMEYYKAAKMLVFSCDTGLYIDALSHDEQPGVHIRRVMGRELSDEEMIEYYSNIAVKQGGEVKAKYKNAICLILDENNIYEHDGEDISSEPFLLTANAHPKRVKGFPLDSISIKINTGQYYFDIHNYERDGNNGSFANGFRDFFIRTILK